ncbi:hypothetical protein U9M48_006868 [Paspalum notatum var. saurae]|uniref:Uncharacterized protein n=1 Tax=Paspalum notatum var. saurae TaxID=547442 RepID=A0AAQ3PTB4_PASNO
MEEPVRHGGVGGKQRGRRTRVVSRRREVHAQRGSADRKLHGPARRRRGPRGDVRRHHGQGGGADVEAERAEDLQQQAEERGVGGVGEDDHGLLLAAAGEALVLALAVEDEAVEEGAARGGRVRDAEGEEGVVDGGAVARQVVGHGVREGGEGDEARMTQKARAHRASAAGSGGAAASSSATPRSETDGIRFIPTAFGAAREKLGIRRAVAPAELGLGIEVGLGGRTPRRAGRGRQRGAAAGGAEGVRGRGRGRIGRAVQCFLGGGLVGGRRLAGALPCLPVAVGGCGRRAGLDQRVRQPPGG